VRNTLYVEKLQIGYGLGKPFLKHRSSSIFHRHLRESCYSEMHAEGRGYIVSSC
jgi:predicted RNase H-like nuclease